MGGRPPFGYDLDKEKSYVVDPQKSLIISRIFNDYGYNNKSMNEIAVEVIVVLTVQPISPPI